MRPLLALILIVGFGFGGYLIFQGGDSEVAEEADSTETALAPETTTPAAPVTVEQAAPPILEAPRPAERGEAERLADRIEEHPGAEADSERVRLAEILLVDDEREPEQEARARKLLEPVVARRGAQAEEAALLLVRNAREPEARLVGATFLLEKGPATPGYADSALLEGRRLAAKNDDLSRVRAWQLLSDAYFSSEEVAWRDAIRPDLERLTADLIHSPRVTSACTQYTVKPGDTLAKIAKAHGTTVEGLRFMNGLKNDLIHPGGNLKLLTGAITVEVRKAAYRLDARLDGRYLFSAPVGLGKLGKTPAGEFVVEVKQENPDWQKSGQKVVPFGDPANPLGLRWIGFKNTPELSGFGIHGTDQPDTVGAESSEGCIRLRNDDVIALYRLVPVGAKVLVQP